MQLSFALVPLIGLAILFQPTQQRVLKWDDGEKRSFQKNAKAYARMVMKPNSLRPATTEIAVKCAGRRNSPYGVTIRTFEMSECSCFGVETVCFQKVCACYESREDVECQFAARVPSQSFLGVMCYWRRGDVLNKNVTKEDICDKWRYPGSDVPQLQMPEYLKSPYSKPLAYVPPQTEKRNGSWPFSKNDWPQNEDERTGYGGLGGLEHLGPNYVLYLVITSQPGDDFKVIVDDAAGKFALPQYFSEDGRLGEPFLIKKAKELRDEMGNCSDDDLLQTIQYKKVLHMGYLKNRLNTDNAWLSGFVVQFDGAYANCFGLQLTETEARKGRYSWASLSIAGSGFDDNLSKIISPLVANYK